MARRFPLLLACTGMVALSIGAGMLYRARRTAPRRSDDAPGRTARRMDFGGYQVVGRTVTIAAPRDLVYEYWRNPRNLSSFMAVDSWVEQHSPEIFHWIFDSPSGPVGIDTRLIEDRKNEALAWRSVAGAEIDIEAKVQLRDTSAGRGTEVEAHIAYRPQGGLAGYWLAKLRGVDPKTRGRQALKRLKMLLETGEIATAENRRIS